MGVFMCMAEDMNVFALQETWWCKLGMNDTKKNTKVQFTLKANG